MTDEQKSRIRNLRQRGLSYKEIADSLCMTKAQVAGFCRRNGLCDDKQTAPRAPAMEPVVAPTVCKNCGRPVTQKPGRKPILFCSDKCCQNWWNHHPEAVHRRPTAIYHYTCACCGKPFTAYGNNHRKYCSHECYITDRFYEGGDGHE